MDFSIAGYKKPFSIPKFSLHIKLIPMQKRAILFELAKCRCYFDFGLGATSIAPIAPKQTNPPEKRGSKKRQTGAEIEALLYQKQSGVVSNINKTAYITNKTAPDLP